MKTLFYEIVSLKKELRYALCVILLCMVGNVRSEAQVALKTNILYDATTTPNIGIEVGVAKKNTLQLFYGFNPWTFHDSNDRERKAKHWVLMPEYRWWTCSKFNGHFFGVHLMGGEFNAGNVNLPVPGVFFKGDNLRKSVKDYRVEGQFAGAGFTYGYQWILNRHWNIEAEIGVGYNHVWYDKYKCDDCSRKVNSGNTNYVGIDKLGLSIIYIF